jgi:CheY-like chemotaxis protein
MSSQPAPRTTPPVKRKVLLVHSIGPHRDLRASIMRKRGCEVVCADDCDEARLLWQPAVYDLVLLDGKHDTLANEELCRDMKSAHPREKVAFLVDKPELLASRPAANGGNSAANPSKSYQRVLHKLMTEACEVLPHRHGFMEAVWRMYLVRSMRSPAAPTRPAPVIPVTIQPNAAPPISFGDAVRQVELEAEANHDKAGA